MGLLYGRAGRLTAQNGGLRPGQGFVETVRVLLRAGIAAPRSVLGGAAAAGAAGSQRR